VQKLLRLLSDPTRLRILAALEGEELAVGEIADVLSMSQSRISNHLRLLKEGDALDARREGAWTFYRNALAGSPTSAPLWEAVKAGLVEDRDFKADGARRRNVLEKRRRRSREYFASRNGGTTDSDTGLEFDLLREELIASLVPHDWTVLDVGCGEGHLTEALSARFAQVIALDHSPERLAVAQRRLAGAGIEFLHGEADDLPLPDASVDAVFFSLVLHHVPGIADVLAECARVLKPGGMVAIADFAPHHDEAMREQMGDLRLGIDPAVIAQTLGDAGFESTATSPARDRFRTGRKHPLDLFLATGRKPLRATNNSSTRKSQTPKTQGTATKRRPRKQRSQS
jgi:SAM-dependent methyltransferase